MCSKIRVGTPPTRPIRRRSVKGRLEALLNFQQMVCDLTGLDLASASLLDEGTAAAEAMSMAKRVSKNPSTTFFVDQDTHPQTIAVIRTRAESFGYEVVVGDPSSDLVPGDVFAALLSYPGSSGEVRDFASRRLSRFMRQRRLPSWPAIF